MSLEAVIAAIEAAFAGVTLGGGVGLQQAQGIDDYADAATCAYFREGDEKDDWRRIPASELNHCNSSLSFFDAEGMRFHLPAYLVAELRGTYGFNLVFCLIDLSDYRCDQLAMLSAAQRSAVRAFLLHLADHARYRYERLAIIAALDSYWGP